MPDLTDKQLRKQSIEQFSKKILIKFLGLFIRSEKIPAHRINIFDCRKILIVRLHDPMGDILLSSAVIPNIKTVLPAVEVDLLTRPAMEPVFKANSYISEIIVFSKKKAYNPFYLAAFISKLRNKKYGAVFVIGSTSASFTSLVLAWFSRAKYRIGFEGSAYGRPSYTKLFLTTEIPYDSSIKHETERNLDLLRALGITITSNSHFMETNEEEDAWAENIYSENNFKEDDIIIGIHPGANRLQGRWPVMNFAKVSDYLIAKFNVKVILFTGPRERQLGAEFLSFAKYPVFAPPLLSLRQFAALVKPLKLFICNDTGVLHIAAAIGAPTLAIFGPTDPLRWNPLGPDQCFLRSEKVEQITVEQAIEKALQMLGWDAENRR